MRSRIFLLLVALCSIEAWAQKSTQTLASATPQPSKKNTTQDNWLTVRKNNFDFDETLLQGKMNAPDGFMLQGRKEQDKKQMVNLRKNFKVQLINSRAAVRAIKP